MATSIWQLQQSDASDEFPSTKLGKGVRTVVTGTNAGVLRDIISKGPAGDVQRICYHFDGHARLRQHFEARLILFPCAPLLAAWLVLSVDNMKTKLSGREPLNGAAEPGRDLLEIDVFDVTKSVRAKNRCNASRLETAGPTFINFLELFGPLRY